LFDVSDLLLRPVASALLWIARVLWWLGWEFFVETIGWSIGWPICRALTLGRFPDTGFRDQEETSWWASLLVELVGLGALLGAIWLLSRYLQVPVVIGGA